MTDSGNGGPKGKPLSPLEEWFTHKAWRAAAAEVIQEYADTAKRLLSESDAGTASRKDGTPDQETKRWALHLARQCAELEHPFPKEVTDLLAACLSIKDPNRFPDVPARYGPHWDKAVEYDANCATNVLSKSGFDYGLSSRAAKHVWPDSDPGNSRKTLERWRTLAPYKRDVLRCWFRQNPGKVTAELLERLQRDDPDSEAK